MTIQPWETDPAAVAYKFMTADGANSPEQIDDMISEYTPEDAAKLSADEAAEMWDLHVDRDDLEAAILAFIQRRPDRA